MEGLKIIEKSYNSILKFKEAITADSFSQASSLVINLKNYDMKTKEGIKTAVRTVLEVYKDDLDIPIIEKVLCTDTITIKIPKDVDGFREDLVDSLKTYIEQRAPSLWNSISNMSLSGGLYSV